jgi:hypothetical protein
MTTTPTAPAHIAVDRSAIACAPRTVKLRLQAGDGLDGSGFRRLTVVGPERDQTRAGLQPDQPGAGGGNADRATEVEAEENNIWVSQSSEDSGQPWQNTIGEPDPQSFKKISKPSDVVIVGMRRSFGSVAVGVGCQEDLAAACDGFGFGDRGANVVQAEFLAR